MKEINFNYNIIMSSNIINDPLNKISGRGTPKTEYGDESPKQRFQYDSEESNETIYRHRVASRSTLTAGQPLINPELFRGTITPPSLQRSERSDPSPLPNRENENRNTEIPHCQAFKENEKGHPNPLLCPPIRPSGTYCPCPHTYNIGRTGWASSLLNDPFLFRYAPKFFNNPFKRHHYYFNLFGQTIYMGWF